MSLKKISISFRKLFFLFVVIFAGLLSLLLLHEDRKKPNVIVLLLDCVRAGHLGCYGYLRPTSPQIDELANRGCLFTFALSQSSWTLPSVATLFTGCHPASHGAGVRLENQKFHFSKGTPVIGPVESIPLMTEYFVSHGYEVFFFSSNAHLREKFFNRGTTQFVIENLAGAERVVDFGIETLRESRDASKPFFLYLHFMDCHIPIQPPDSYFNLFQFNDKKNTGIHKAWRYTKAKDQGSSNFAAYKKQKICVYDGALRYIDDQIGRLVREVDALKLRENTLIIVAADHGEEFWDHAEVEHASYQDPRGIVGIGHGHSMFQELLHVPLIISGAGVNVGRKIDYPARIIDVLPTVLDWTGQPLPSHLEGQSLAACLKGVGMEGLPTILSEFPAYGAPRISLVRYPYKYIFSLNEEDFFFHLEADPLEKINLVDFKQKEANSFLHKIMDHFNRYASLNRGKESFLSAEDIEALKKLGYIK